MITISCYTYFIGFIQYPERMFSPLCRFTSQCIHRTTSILVCYIIWNISWIFLTSLANKKRALQNECSFFDVEYIYGFVWWGVCKQSRWRHSVTVPSRHKMADMRYYGNVMTTRWWLCVTMETLWYSTSSTVVIDWTCYVFFSLRHHGTAEVFSLLGCCVA